MPDAWEEAYQRFETPDEELRKFTRRLDRLGAARMKKGAIVLEVFCGRGSGLNAWRRFGFSRVTGIDLSLALLRAFPGEASLSVGNAETLPIRSEAVDIVCIQGGLHHLRDLRSVERSLDEIARVLGPGGSFLCVEPWSTPFLRLVHRLCAQRALRSLWPRLDALATMIDGERETYERWLGSGPAVMKALADRFEFVRLRIALGKIEFLARPRPPVSRSPATPP